MEYNTKKTVEAAKRLAQIIQYDAKDLAEHLDVKDPMDINYNELECLYRVCEMIENEVYRAKTLIGKMLDERDDMEEEEEGE